jgi:ubiquinone biosynthesis protein UbiJ
VLHAALNHLLNQRADLRAELARHAGMVGRLSVFPFVLTFLVDGEGWLTETKESPHASVTIRPGLLPRLLLDDAAAKREVRLEGDAAFAADLARMLQALNWDAEADLARLMGDAVSHRVVSGSRELFGEPRAILREVAATVVEYLQEEATVLAARPSVERFYGEVDQVRDDLARIEKRLRLLEALPPKPQT